MKALRFLCESSILTRRKTLAYSISMATPKRVGSSQLHGSSSRAEEESELKHFTEFMESLKNYEKSGVPKDAGTDSDDGFDLGRMRRLMELLDDPLSKFKVVHVAGTKGKGSTAAFIANILRAEGYSVGCYTSPHIQTIRERISLGRMGEPVSSTVLNSLFHRVKESIERAMELENGRLSHFEVLTALAFKLFAQQNVDIAVIEAGLGGARDATNVISSSGLEMSVITTIGEEHLAALGGSLESIAVAKSGIIKKSRPVVFGGPFLPHIERILLDRASVMSSPVVSAFEAGKESKIKGINLLGGRPSQCCDIVIELYSHSERSIKLSDVNLYMLGSHQLHNAITATCTALCLRQLGWRLSDKSIKSGLESTSLLGRSQFLTSKEAETLGLSESMILLDGAHTKDSAKALVDTIKMAFPEVCLALIVSMASDKDHLGFAREFLSGGNVEAVFLTEATIAGGKSRTTSASLLRDCWIEASKDLGISTLHDKMPEYQKLFDDEFVEIGNDFGNRTVLVSEDSFSSSMKMANQILKAKRGNRPGIIAVTGSLHAVSLVLSVLHE